MDKSGLPSLRNLKNPTLAKPHYTEKQSTVMEKNDQLVNPIRTIEDLQNIFLNEPSIYILQNDIDLSGVNWQPIGYTYNVFNGILDGKWSYNRKLININR